jgi:hypothetical protein
MAHARTASSDPEPLVHCIRRLQKQAEKLHNEKGRKPHSVVSLAGEETCEQVTGQEIIALQPMS